MEVPARELCLSIGSGPRPELRQSLRKLLPGLSSLIIQVDLVASNCTVMATTPNIIEIDIPSTKPLWQLKLFQAESSEWEEITPAGQQNQHGNGHVTMSGKFQR